jgi:hypothetical protein
MDTDMVLLTNALMGVVPALSLDDRPLKIDHSLIAVLNRSLFHAAEVGGSL